MRKSQKVQIVLALVSTAHLKAVFGSLRTEFLAGG